MAYKHSFTLTLTAIIAILFLLLPANAGLHGILKDGERIILQEIAAPEAAGEYYRRPGKLIASEGRKSLVRTGNRQSSALLHDCEPI